MRARVRVVATSTFGNPAEAARIRELNAKRQEKEAARPSAKKRERKAAKIEFWKALRKQKRRDRKALAVKQKRVDRD